MLCQVCVPEIIEQYLHRDQEVHTNFLFYVLIERHLLFIADTIQSGFIMQPYPMYIFTGFSSTAQTRETI
jgi:hypothetical protein